jgi:hypothetical protein
MSASTIEDEGDVAALAHILYEGGVGTARAEKVARHLIAVTDPEFGEDQD